MGFASRQEFWGNTAGFHLAHCFLFSSEFVAHTHASDSTHIHTSSQGVSEHLQCEAVCEWGWAHTPPLLRAPKRHSLAESHFILREGCSAERAPLHTWQAASFLPQNISLLLRFSYVWWNFLSPSLVVPKRSLLLVKESKSGEETRLRSDMAWGNQNEVQFSKEIGLHVFKMLHREARPLRGLYPAFFHLRDPKTPFHSPTPSSHRIRKSRMCLITGVEPG